MVSTVRAGPDLCSRLDEPLSFYHVLSVPIGIPFEVPLEKQPCRWRWWLAKGRYTAHGSGLAAKVQLQVFRCRSVVLGGCAGQFRHPCQDREAPPDPHERFVCCCPHRGGHLSQL